MAKPLRREKGFFAKAGFGIKENPAGTELGFLLKRRTDYLQQEQPLPGFSPFVSSSALAVRMKVHSQSPHFILYLLSGKTSTNSDFSPFPHSGHWNLSTIGIAPSLIKICTLFQEDKPS
jgi:hypothetical protein